MFLAEAMRVKYNEANVFHLEARKTEAAMRAELREVDIRQRIRAIEEDKIGRQTARSKAVQLHYERIQKEKEEHFQRCREDAERKEKLRQEALAKAAQDGVKKNRELQLRVEASDQRTKEVLQERSHIAEKRSVEKDLILEDRACMQTRIRRLQGNVVESVSKKTELKVNRIETLLKQKDEEDELLRRQQVEIIRNPPVKKEILPTPGPADYDALDSLAFALDSKAAVKISLVGKAREFHDATPGPGQYPVNLVTLRKINHNAPKLPPKEKDLEALSACLAAANEEVERTMKKVTGSTKNAGTSTPAHEATVDDSDASKHQEDEAEVAEGDEAPAKEKPKQKRKKSIFIPEPATTYFQPVKHTAAKPVAGSPNRARARKFGEYEIFQQQQLFLKQMERMQRMTQNANF